MNNNLGCIDILKKKLLCKVDLSGKKNDDSDIDFGQISKKKEKNFITKKKVFKRVCSKYLLMANYGVKNITASDIYCVIKPFVLKVENILRISVFCYLKNKRIEHSLKQRNPSENERRKKTVFDILSMRQDLFKKKRERIVLIVFNSIESAKNFFKVTNGLELNFLNFEMDLRFVPCSSFEKLKKIDTIEKLAPEHSPSLILKKQKKERLEKKLKIYGLDRRNRTNIKNKIFDRFFFKSKQFRKMAVILSKIEGKNFSTKPKKKKIIKKKKFLRNFFLKNFIAKSKIIFRTKIPLF